MADYLAGSIKNLNTLLGEQLLDGSGSGGGGGDFFVVNEFDGTLDKTVREISNAIEEDYTVIIMGRTPPMIVERIKGSEKSGWSVYVFTDINGNTSSMYTSSDKDSYPHD